MSHRSRVNRPMGRHVGHGSQNVTQCQLCSLLRNVRTRHFTKITHHDLKNRTRHRPLYSLFTQAAPLWDRKLWGSNIPPIPLFFPSPPEPKIWGLVAFCLPDMCGLWLYTHNIGEWTWCNARKHVARKCVTRKRDPPTDTTIKSHICTKTWQIGLSFARQMSPADTVQRIMLLLGSGYWEFYEGSACVDIEANVDCFRPPWKQNIQSKAADVCRSRPAGDLGRSSPLANVAPKFEVPISTTHFKDLNGRIVPTLLITLNHFANYFLNFPKSLDSQNPLPKRDTLLVHSSGTATVAFFSNFLSRKMLCTRLVEFR